MASYPLSNFIPNLGAETDGHIDPMDDSLCVAIPFGEWDFGGLCLSHLGLALELHAGDLVLFPSDQITHFSMWVSGLRGSIVLSTNKTLRGWMNGGNYWGNYIN